uniref:Uncharacterized protein n=1 Tax=Parascaris univalens TaxID=6257 RepID=A0A915A9S3_PARUN
VEYHLARSLIFASLLSNPNGSCSNSLQSIYMSTLTA